MPLPTKKMKATIQLMNAATRDGEAAAPSDDQSERQVYTESNLLAQFFMMRAVDGNVPRS